MPRYSVATTRNNLSQLIDKAVAGEEVIITRHGKPTVSLSVVESKPQSDVQVSEAMDWLKARRESRSKSGIGSAQLVRQMRDEYRY
jgi:prevent-host-death family protein